MKLDKQQVLALLQDREHMDIRSKAEADLPEEVDTEQDADLLHSLGVDPADIEHKFSGGKMF